MTRKLLFLMLLALVVVQCAGAVQPPPARKPIYFDEANWQALSAIGVIGYSTTAVDAETLAAINFVAGMSDADINHLIDGIKSNYPNNKTKFQDVDSFRDKCKKYLKRDGDFAALRDRCIKLSDKIWADEHGEGGP